VRPADGCVPCYLLNALPRYGNPHIVQIFDHPFATIMAAAAKLFQYGLEGFVGMVNKVS